MWLGPNLEEVDDGFVVAIVFRVTNPSSSGSELHVAAFENLEVPHAVFMLKFTRNDV